MKKPIEAEITKIGKVTTRPSRADFKFKDTTVTINAGKKHGLQPGMVLYVADPDPLVETVAVESIADSEAQGVFTQIGEDEPAPKVGWKLSTRAPWRHMDKGKPLK